MVKTRANLKPIFKLFIFLYTPTVILLILIFLVSLATGIPVGKFTQDPAVIAGKAGLASSIDLEINAFLGLISSLGVLLWCACASICFFAFLITFERKNKIRSDRNLFLAFFGSTTFILLFDDLFLFHEALAPNLFIPEKLVYICYALMVLFGIIRFRKIILQTEWIILCFALLFFLLSLVIDTFGVGYGRDNLNFILEDGFKILGIVSWSSYFTIASFQFTRNVIFGK